LLGREYRPCRGFEHVGFITTLAMDDGTPIRCFDLVYDRTGLFLDYRLQEPECIVSFFSTSMNLRQLQDRHFPLRQGSSERFGNDFPVKACGKSIIAVLCVEAGQQDSSIRAKVDIRSIHPLPKWRLCGII